MMRARKLLQPRVSAENLPAEVVHIQMSTAVTRSNGFGASAYLVGDVLVDTGFAHVRSDVLGVLAHREISAICCTHHHEDHAGNCGTISELRDCPVFLRNATEQWSEGVDKLAPYRQIYWGAPAPYTAREMPPRIDAGRGFSAIPIPGHSVTHTALFEEETGIVFTGDLFINSGVSAVMQHENPYDSVDSLRRIAALEPSLMLTGHGLSIDTPAPKLLDKATRIEDAAGQAVELHRLGLPTIEVVRRVFRGGLAKDRLMAALTSKEFSRMCFVRGAVRHDR